MLFQGPKSFLLLSKINLSLYVQRHHLPNCTETTVGFFQRFITVRPSVLGCWHVRQF